MGLLDWLTGGSKSSGSTSSGSSSKPSSYSGNFNYNHNSPSYTQTQTGNKYSGGNTSENTTKSSFTGVQIGGTTAAQGVKEATGKTTTTYTPPGTSTSQPTVSGAVSGVSSGKTSGTGGSTGETASPTSNIQTAKPVQSNISGTSSTPTWTMTYTNAENVNDPSRTTETWMSSDGRQVAFAGISASDLAKYYADKGDTKNATTFAQIANQSSGSTYTASNWRNSDIGEAISLGTATQEQKLAAIGAGASAETVNLYNTPDTFETTPYYQSTHPDEPTSKTLFTSTGGDPIVVPTSSLTPTENSSGIPTETTNSGNIPTGWNAGDAPAPGGNISGAGAQEIIINVPAQETTPTGSGDNSGILALLTALFMKNLSNQGGNLPADGTSDMSYSAEEPAEESDTAPWKQYALPIGIALVGIAVVVALFSNKKGGKK